MLLKDEARNPTGSFKARGMTLAVTMAKALGARALAAPSAGNAAGALAAYGAAANLPVTVAMPRDTPRAFVEECRHYGAEVHLVDGTIADAGKWLKANGPKDAFDVSTLKEPYRIEGKKTMAYELYEQLGELPDAIVYPTGGGTGLVGMWKAFGEMQSMGWTRKKPRLISVQAEGCAPVVKAFQEGAQVTAPWPDARTAAYGLRVPSPIGGFLCLRALRETNGTAVAVPEAGQAKPRHDVLEDGHGGERVRLLEDHSDPAPDQHGILGVEILALEEDGARRPGSGHDFVHPVETADERRLPAARRADDRRDAAGHDRQVDVLEDMVGDEPGVQLLDQDAVGHPFTSPGCSGRAWRPGPPG